MSDPIDPFLAEPRIAYLSMEMALRSEIATYSGGLGVLAGDTMRSAADLGLPMVGVTLASRLGYFRQTIVDGRQVEVPDPWDPARWATRLSAKAAISIDGRDVWAGGWLYVVQGGPGTDVPVILLDTDLPENSAEDRAITSTLYGGDEAYRLSQEMVLGIGAARMLRALGFRIRKYHLNEGHAALMTLELLRWLARTPEEAGTRGPGYDPAAVRQRCIFTTHTPVEAGHDQFPYELADRLLGGLVDPTTVRTFAGAERLNMTRLALSLSEYVNGVAKRHAEVSQRMFPGYRIHAVTNGVHPRTWTCPSFCALYDEHVPHWCHEPELLGRVDRIADEAVWDAHARARQALLASIATRAARTLDPGKPLVGFARRMTAYKRPDLLFRDLARLRAIARQYPFQVVVAGKAHPHDEGGKGLIERIHRWSRELGEAVPVVFLPNYDMELAKLLVSGVDVWVNTPQPPLEASGTSGMKAALNGVPSLSVLDGWWLEGCIEGVTGWAVGDDGTADHEAALYDQLEKKVMPLYHGDRPGWIAVMKGAISRNAAFFNTHRMMRRYAVEAYLR